MVASTDREHLGGNGPSNSKGVELLDVSTRPDAGTSMDLRMGAWFWTTLIELIDAIFLKGNGRTYVIIIETESGNGILRSEEDHEHKGEYRCDDEPPPWKRGLHHIQAYDADDPRSGKGDKVPGGWRFVVVDHYLVMRIEKRIFKNLLFLFWRVGTVFLPEDVAGRLQSDFRDVHVDPIPSTLDFVVVPEEHVDKSGGETSVGCNKIGDISTSQVWHTLDFDEGVVDGEVVVEDRGLIIWDVVGGI